jgi:hypothetical protein
MRITEIESAGQSKYIVTIGPGEPFLMVKLGICFLEPVSSPGGCSVDPVFKWKSDNYVFHADAAQFAEYDRHMECEYPGWRLATGDSEGLNVFGDTVKDPVKEDDPSDRGVKTPVRRLNKNTMDRLFTSPEELDRMDIAAADSLSPQRDIDRKGRKAI